MPLVKILVAGLWFVKLVDLNGLADFFASLLASLYGYSWIFMGYGWSLDTKYKKSQKCPAGSVDPIVLHFHPNNKNI